MRKFTSILGSLTLVASLGAAVVACGNGSKSTDGGMTVDLSPGPDLITPPDMTTTQPTGAGTGEACTKAADCANGNKANQKAQCITSLGSGAMQVVFKNGYCSAPCTKDADCPGDNAVCNQGACYAGCNNAMIDCRSDEDYVCLNIGVAACWPKDSEWCDPTQTDNCGEDAICVSYSPDNSAGQCNAKCDPIAQDCPPMQGTSVACFEGYTGQTYTFSGVATCSSTSGTAEGEDCTYLNECAAGLGCDIAKDQQSAACARYCLGGATNEPTDGGTANNGACPDGYTCNDPSTHNAVATGKLGFCEQ